MSDLVEYLRKRNPRLDPDCHEAADEIERLRLGPRCIISGNPCGTDTWTKGNPPDCHCGKMWREIERLKLLVQNKHAIMTQHEEVITDNLKRIAHLERVIAEAKHSHNCRSRLDRKSAFGLDPGGYDCNCWKSRVGTHEAPPHQG